MGIDFTVNVVVGVALSFISVLASKHERSVTVKEYILIIVLAAFLTGFVVENWLSNRSVFVAGLAGLCVGLVADDLLLNIQAVMPNFIKTTVEDLFAYLRHIVGKIVGRG